MGDTDTAQMAPLSIVDSHCHFDFAAFAEDRQQIWQECQHLGMRHLLIPGVSPEQWPEARKLCQEHPGLIYAAGLHPWWLDKVRMSAESLVEQIESELAEPNCRAIGECGLDALMGMPIERQMPLLEAQIALAKRIATPIILHCVKAHNPMIRALKHHELPTGGVIHAYAGSYEQAMQYWQMGFYLGIGGTITYERAKKTRDAVSRLPIEALVLESDAPDMPLQGHQGQRNSPTAVMDIAHCLAQLRGEPVEQIIRQTSANASKIFSL